MPTFTSDIGSGRSNMGISSAIGPTGGLVHIRTDIEHAVISAPSKEFQKQLDRMEAWQIAIEVQVQGNTLMLAEIPEQFTRIEEKDNGT